MHGQVLLSYRQLLIELWQRSIAIEGSGIHCSNPESAQSHGREAAGKSKMGMRLFGASLTKMKGYSKHKSKWVCHFSGGHNSFGSPFGCPLKQTNKVYIKKRLTQMKTTRRTRRGMHKGWRSAFGVQPVCSRLARGPAGG